MNIEEQIALFGTRAILEYRDKPALRRSETSIPEVCVSLSIASQLITNSNLTARVEVSYKEILSSLGARVDNINNVFGGLRADIVTFDDDVPSAVIEVKIIDEKRRPIGVKKDYDRIARLQRHLQENGLSIIPGYLGVLVCDIEGRSAQQAIDSFCQEHRVNPLAVTYGVRSSALSGVWDWVFICVKIV